MSPIIFYDSDHSPTVGIQMYYYTLSEPECHYITPFPYIISFNKHILFYIIISIKITFVLIHINTL